MMRTLALACCFVVLAAGIAAAQGIMAPKFDPAGAIQIQAERLEVDNAEHVIRFEGKVTATQGDAVLNCDVLLIRYMAPDTTPEPTDNPFAGASGGGEVQSLVAMGRVALVQGNRRATADRAEYDNAGRAIVLTGKPMVAQDDDALRGDRIHIDVATQRVQVVGGPSGRVSVTINPRTISPPPEKAP